MRVPYDFDELSFLEVSNVNFDDLEKEGKTKIGMVVNLDKHNKSGSHWVSLFIDLNNDQIYFLILLLINLGI